MVPRKKKGAPAPPEDPDTRVRLLQAAGLAFAGQGYEGARTQAIADQAGVNKAMLYYHFRNKQHLYDQVLAAAMEQIVGTLIPTLMKTEWAPRRRLLETAQAYHQLLTTHPHLRSLLLRELAAGGTRLDQVFQQIRRRYPEVDPARVFEGLTRLMEQGDLRPGDPRQVLLHMLALSIFPHMVRPVLTGVWGLSDQQADRLFAERPRAVHDLLENGLFPDRQP